jgi:hypothetical protein
MSPPEAARNIVAPFPTLASAASHTSKENQSIESPLSKNGAVRMSPRHQAQSTTSASPSPAGPGARPPPPPPSSLIARVNQKCIKSYTRLIRLTLSLPLQLIFLMLIGLNVQYSGPQAFGIVWVGACLSEQLLAYMEVRLLSISIEKVK